MDINRLRSETPGTANVIHFNNAGSSLPPKPVTEVMTSYLREESLHGGYETAEKYEEEIEQFYTDIASFINAGSGEIALMENATAAWNMAFHAIDFNAGDRILTSSAEYASNFITYLKLKKEKGIHIEIIPDDETGRTSAAHLAEMMDDSVKLISITHIPTNSGLVNPVEEIGKVAQQYPCFYLVDACQSVGHYPVDVQKIGCDMLSTTGRKYLRGPRGTGFLHVRQSILERLTPPFLDLHSAEWIGEEEFNIREDARRFENWEFNYAGVVGLGKAVNYAANLSMENIWNRITRLAEILRDGLSRLSGVTVRDIGSMRCGIVTFTVENMDAQQVKDYLAKRDINVSVSDKNSTFIDMNRRNLDSVVRSSVHYYNTEEEIDSLIKAINTIST